MLVKSGNIIQSISHNSRSQTPDSADQDHGPYVSGLRGAAPPDLISQFLVSIGRVWRQQGREAGRSLDYDTV